MDCRLNILVVEDNEEFRHTLVDILSHDGHYVTGVDCAESVAEQSASFELALIDLNLPGEDGLSLAHRLRHTHPHLGIIMVTARQLPSERVQGYASGADLYLAKPVNLLELRAAIGALARRISPKPVEQTLWLNPKALHLVGFNAEIVSLSAPQTILLQAFARAAEQRLESWQLIELLEQQNAQDPKAALELHIVRLRKKLVEAGAPIGSIKAIRNWGYALSVPIRVKGSF